MTDIVKDLRDFTITGAEYFRIGQLAANEIEILRTEIDCLGQSLDKCHAKLMGISSPVVDCRNSNEAPFRPPECGGFQGFED